MKRDLKPWDRSVQPPLLTPEYKSTLSRAPSNKLITLPHALEDDSGPAFGHGHVREGDNNLITNAAAPDEKALGHRILIHGVVMDEEGRGLPHTLVEIWQANAAGRYRHRNDSYAAPLDPNFAGGGRTLTDEKGHYRFLTIKPAPYPFPNGPNSWRPAHIHFSVFGNSFAQRLITQMYFEGDPLIRLCPVANTTSTPHALVAKLDMKTAKPFDYLAWRFDIVLRGRKQTPFENLLQGL